MDSSAGSQMSDRFVGRADELHQALSACAAAGGGRGTFLVVSGAAGIGKTRFCQELVSQVSRSGLNVVMARCWADGGAPALWPWQGILSELCGPEAAELLAADAGSLTVDPDRFERFKAVLARLTESCRRTPACLVIDDIHAADGGTLLLTRFVARALERLPLALVVTRRPDEPAADRPETALLSDLEREAVPIALRPFDVEETTSFFQAHGLPGLSPDLVRTLQRTTEGNPLFLQRIAALGPPRPGQAHPEGVRTAIYQALARLAPTTQKVLRASALLGSTASVAEVVRLMVDANPAAVLDAVEEAAEAGLVVAGQADRFTFSHELIRSALEDALDTAHRLDLHARAAALVDDSGEVAGLDRLARRAHQALAAAPRSTDDARLAVGACRDAARSMVRSFAYERAEALLSAAVALQQPSDLGPPSAELLVEWAQAALACGWLAEARVRFDRAAIVAEHAGAPATFAEAALGMGGHWVNERRDPIERARVLGLQRAALAELDPSEVALRCRLEARLAAEAVYDGESVEIVRAPLAAARVCRDLAALAEALSLAHHALLTPEHMTERLALADELVQVGSEAGSGLLALMGLCWRTVDLFHLGDERALRALEDLRERSGALACRSILYIVDVLDVMLLIRAGRLDEAERRAGQCYELGVSVGEVDTLGYFSAHMLAIRWMQGRDAELLDQAEQVSVSPTLVRSEFAFRASAAAIAAHAGQTDRARQALEGLAADGLKALPQSSTWLAGMYAIIEVAEAVDDPRIARESYGLLRPFADLPVMPSLGVMCFGSAHRALGLAAQTFGDMDLAVEHLEAAVAANRRLRNRPVEAISQADLASVLRQRGHRGDRARAAELVEEAIQAAVGMGMTERAEAWRAEHGTTVDGERSGTVRREAHGWLIALEGHRAVHAPDLVGMRYLAELLTHPGQPIHALDLAGAGGSGQVVAEGSRQEILDDQARAAYAERARQLGEALEEAEASADVARAERLRTEMDALADQLASATGLGQRARTFTGPSERARTAVRKAVARALDAIRAEDNELCDLLEASITTGATCLYTPAPHSPIHWSR